jgi:TonB-linked SusC/RagA family outer membrane protein
MSFATVSARRSRIRFGALGLLSIALAVPFSFNPSVGVAQAQAPRFTGSVRGKVTERGTNQSAPSVQIVVVGTRLGAVTDNNGNFVIRGVPAGAASLRAVRIGYQAATQPVTITDGGEAVVNFALDRAVTQLDQVVTTATGTQSRREMGNVVATLAADSLASTAPIADVNEMLQARTPGVQIIQGQGVVGASSSIRIRGNSSLSLSNEPLIVMDGIRYSNESEGTANVSGIKMNRFSTMNPEEIESIDIIKGPSAAALYGTAAANGVIVVKTKRGRAGSARWSTFLEGGIAQMPATYPTNYMSWGRNINQATKTITNQTAVQCKLANKAQGFCVVDSLGSYNPWTAAETNPFGNGGNSKGGVQVTGGSDLIKYFLSADVNREAGPYSMPDYEIQRITALRGSAPREEQLHPNRLRQTSLRGSFSFPIASSATLDFSTSYQDRDLWTPFDGTFFAGLSNQLFTGPGFKNATNGTAREFVGDIYSVQQRNQLGRFTGTGAFNWTPITWLQLTAEGGVDNSNANNSRFQYPGEGTNKAVAWGPAAGQGYSGVDLYRVTSLAYTATVRGAATRQLTSWLGSVTTIGGQFFRTGRYELLGEGYGLGLGATTPTAAQQRLATTSTDENATYGYYLQQQLNYADKLYLTVSARTDLNSAFGLSAPTTYYPAANVSYVVSEERWFPKLASLDRLRLRASVGKAGLQPGTTAALPYLQPLTYPAAGGGEAPGLTIQQVGNKLLKPEVTTEYEGGFDAGFLGGRFNVEFTAFQKKSDNQLFNSVLPPSYGVGPNKFINVAQVVNAGQELAIDVQVVQTNPFAWGIRLNGSHVNNKLVSIGDFPLPLTQGTRNVVGYPLFGLWDRPYTYNDANNDGIIAPSEIAIDAVDAYKGSTLPVYEAGMSNSFTLFNGRVNVNTLIDYRGQFWNSYGIGSNRCVSAGNCQAVNDPTASLEDQAAAVAASSAALKNSRWYIFQPNDFIKLREVSIAANLPEAFTSRYLRGRSAQLVLASRNVATLWTKYPGIDPEANRLVNGNDDLGTPPALRTFQARVNLGF